MADHPIRFAEAPAILNAASVVGKQEHEGPLGDCFDAFDPGDTFGQKTWEQSESEMQRRALNLALAKAKLRPDDVDLLLAGDLINQCTSSAQGLLSFGRPLYGLYGACSTAIEALSLAALLCAGGFAKRLAAVTSSHNSSAERQFRFPLEYGGQRTPTSQWTVTGSAAFLVGMEKSGPYLSEILPGRPVDRGICDANNMGAAMAPAAVDTLTRYFQGSGTKPEDFDLIVTGDLGREGHGIVLDLMQASGYDLSGNYTDCGLLIYDLEKQDKHAGGSGCGCSATVLASHLLPRLRRGELRDMLILGTGALMSPMTVQQGLSIPGIAHLARITTERLAPKK